MPTTVSTGEASPKSFESIKVFEDLDDYSELDEPSLSEELFNTLSKFNNLTTLDCFFDLDLDSQSSEIEFASTHLTKAEYEAGTNFGPYPMTPRERRLKQAMVEAAETFMHYLPSLESGYFWSHPPCGHRSEPRHYRRWAWSSDKSSTHSPQILLAQIPNKYPRDFTDNMDGTDQPRYVSDQEDNA